VRLHVVEALPRNAALLDLAHHVLGDLLELAQRAHALPHALVDHLGQVERLVGELCPAAVQRDLVHGADEAVGRLRDVDHVGHQSKSVELQLRYVGLEQDIDLGAGLLDALLHRDRHPLEQLAQLQLLLFADCQVAELVGEGEDAEELDLAEGGLHEHVVDRHGLVGAVVVGSNAAQFGRLQHA